jgi:phenylpropionate dioxygenase-like ring-hydroxylating dioxygenase large terminal subunit
MHLDRQVKFPSFPDQWTPVTSAKSLDKKGMLATQLDGVPLVFFRDRDGKACALVDQCPHRSVKLSEGKLTEERHIQCPFHGWRYDGQGNCTHIALNPDARLGAVQASALPCQELGGLLWVYTATETTDVLPLQAPESLSSPNWFGTVIEREWDTHWSRATQTMLDVAHIPFVHRRTIGFAFGRALGISRQPRLETKLTEGAEDAFRLDWQIQDDKGTPSADAGWLEFLPPNGITLPIPTKSTAKHSLLHIWCVPIAGNRSRMVVVNRRNFGQFNPLLSLFNLLTPVILQEDRRVMDTAHPSEVPPLGFEVFMPSDAPTIAFCRYYQKRFLN